MRSEKDQMTVGKEKSVVEIQFRDIPREQENTSGNPKQKEEKKEVFTKVGSRAFEPCRIVYAAWGGRHGGDAEGSFQHRGQRREFEAVDSRRSRGFTHLQPPLSLYVTFKSDFISCNDSSRWYFMMTFPCNVQRNAEYDCWRFSKLSPIHFLFSACMPSNPTFRPYYHSRVL